MFKDCGKHLVGIVWVPSYRKQEFLDHMEDIQRQGLNCAVTDRAVDEELTRPTYFRETEFSWVF